MTMVLKHCDVPVFNFLLQFMFSLFIWFKWFIFIYHFHLVMYFVLLHMNVCWCGMYSCIVLCVCSSDFINLRRSSNWSNILFHTGQYDLRPDVYTMNSKHENKSDHISFGFIIIWSLFFRFLAPFLFFPSNIACNIISTNAISFSRMKNTIWGKTILKVKYFET